MFIDFQAPHAPSEQIQPASAPNFDEQFNKAKALANSGQPELALAAYNTLLTRSPGNADVLLGRGIAYARLQRWTEAESDLTAAANAAPDYADVWLALGNMYRWSERPAKAAEALSRVVALKPQDAEARLARAAAFRAMGRSAEARADLEQARALGGGAAAEDALAAMQPRAGVPAAAAPAGYRWAASLGASVTDAGNGQHWNDETVSVRHYGGPGSLAFETLRAHRFGEADFAWALDAYTDLWHGAYANLRYQHSPAARLFPANSGRVELYQSLGRGWEASVSDDVLGFANSRVNIYGTSVAKYIGNFYLQLRHQNIVSPGSHSAGDRLLGRYYYAGDADSYVELAGNRGRSDDPLSLVGGRARSGGASLAWVHYWAPDWGTKVGVNASRSDGTPGQRELSFSLFRRW